MIESGDDVRHKSRVINGGLTMTVQAIENGHALCEPVQPDGSFKPAWFPLDQLELIHKADGGFKKEGEK